MFANISTYQFAPLTDLKALRAKLQALGKSLKLRGSILLSTEGINLFVAGERPAVDTLLAELRQIRGLENLTPKLSESRDLPFNRMLVRIKKEIIAFGVEGIEPSRYTSPKLTPRELKRWIDEGREFALLDTRNDYEIKLGTFKNAISPEIKHFREFPDAVQKLSPHLRNIPVVTFCTGGIRCEKAAPYLETQGFKEVYQLDGGILKYFEECGNAHYDRNCFVFDKRVGVDPCLQETSDAQCFACLTPLTPEDQKDSRYEKGKSCHYCFQNDDDKMHVAIANRQAAFAKLTHPLPGSVPYRQERPLKISAKFAGKPLIEFLTSVFRHVERRTWEEAAAQDYILGPTREPVTLDTLVEAGERYYHLSPSLDEPDVNTDIRLIYEDESIIVLEKPSPLPVHPCGRFNRNTLQYFLNAVYAPEKPHPAHRLDANTTGLMVITRTKHFAGILQPQFSEGKVEKRYLARVHGTPSVDEFRCELALGEATYQLGARFPDESGQAAITEFTVLERFTDETSLLEVRPITGRTNQIRIHLWELGFPIVGDQLYLPDRKLGRVQTGTVDDAPLCLHARSLSFMHPVSGNRVTFQARAVEWASGAILF